MKLLLNLYPPYLGTGIRVTHLSRDYRHIHVEMTLAWYNRNYVNTHFGGSLYAMTDPFYMLMLMQNLGPGYLVWDRSAGIDFLRPGRGTVHADFRLTGEQVRGLKDQAEGGDKVMPEYVVDILDADGETVARVFKQLYIRKTQARQGSA
jgi:acyl-coenzyme A thioesterase PaaI-like protein